MTEIIIQVDKEVLEKYTANAKRLGWRFPQGLVRHLLSDLSDSHGIAVYFIHPKKKE